MLTPGSSPATNGAASLRGWARVLEWHQADTPARLARLAWRAAWTPVRAWKEAGGSVARFGAEVEAVAGTSPRRQRWQLWWLATRHGLNEKSYLDYQLYRPERLRIAGAYLQERELFRVGRWLNRQIPRTDYPIADKLAFAEWCRTNSLASVPTLVEYEQGALVLSTLSGDPAESLPSRDLFSKPSDGTGGHGSERWLHVREPDGRDSWVGRDGRSRSAAELLDELAHRSLTLAGKYGKASRRMLLQPCLRNHRDLLPLTPGGLCTVRLVTYRMPGGAALALRAMYKMPIGDSPADNFCYGGMIAPVCLATGRLGPAVRRRGPVLVPAERHPDTGALVEGHQLPYWT
ncbi:MAG: sugar-transfer associated ATP-grasp domain-containing protein, partial [Gemmatimonadaceae bacterium]